MQFGEAFQTFITEFTQLLDKTGNDEEHIFVDGKELLAELIAQDDWLPQAFTESGEGVYRQYLLHLDPEQRFSVVSFVWGPGQHTPVHDHTVWGMVGVLRGRELCEEYRFDESAGTLEKAGEHLIEPGGIDLVSPRVGDVHRVSNALEDQASISIHVYGADIGTTARHVFEDDGSVREFISGYSNV